MWAKLRGQSIALAALAIALGGTSYAALNLPPNSVGKKQIKRNAVNSKKVKDGSLLDDDFKAGQLPRGDAGPQGPAGDAGPQGPAGEAGRSALTVLQPGETVRGNIAGNFQESTTGGDWRAVVSYPIPATSPPANLFVNGITPGETCTGTSGQPTAPPGTVCVYPDATSNPVPGTNSHSIVNSNAFGFSLNWVTTSTGDTLFRGTYAMTQG